MAPKPEQPQNSVSKTIDQNGGEVRLGNEAWVIIPPGALDSALVITITKIPDPLKPPVNYVSRGAAYSFMPHYYTFNDTVTVGITYQPDTTLAAPAMVKLDDDVDASWEFVVGAGYVGGTATYRSLTFSILSVTSFRPLAEVYVSINSQGLNATGTRDDPLPTVSAGIDAAEAAGQPHPPVLVASGTYEETLVFADGVSIQGGLDPETWEYSAEPNQFSVVDLGRSSARATGITDSTHIVGLVLHAASARQGAPAASMNSVALHLVDCWEGLLFQNCRFIAGDGANGAPGDTGVAGADGGDGWPAGRDENDVPYNGNYALGGPGGTGASVYAGGSGGNGGTIAGQQGGHGQGWAGEPCHGGCGGVGAWLTESWDGGYGPFGSHGANGTAGENDQPGMEEGWIPIPADSNAAPGQHGCGGGGGGGGVHGTEYGMGGGGGGGGGNGGHPGLGGGGGGSSFAVYLWQSSPVFVNCEFYAGNGGNGGKGGNGGDLGDGGAGGLSHGVIPYWPLSYGSHGGVGGDGGFGGSGGGGAGGHSFCVYRFGSVCENADFSRCNIWDFHPGAPGRGGEGGQAVHMAPDSTIEKEGIKAQFGADGKSGIIGPQ